VNEQTPQVGVLVASPAELAVMQQATAILEKLEIPHEIRVMSSSRNPDLVDEYARTAYERGIKVLVCTTGISGHLAAAVALVLHQRDDTLRQPHRRLDRLLARPMRQHGGVEQQHRVDVRGIVQLTAAVLTERNH